MRKGTALLFILLFFVADAAIAKGRNASFFPSFTEYQKANFTTPVDIPVSLAGNFGECRPNHFHSGLDVRTEQRENLNLYAIQEGYISGVTISHKGFGNCIYISHPGGYTSVYAHCNDFANWISEYVKKQQYKKEKWDVSLRFPPHLFPIRKGQYIGKSGNTGSSHAPHLHMEIRNTKTDKTLNGLLFYPHMPDEKKPIISRVAVYDANRSIYHQEPKILKAIKKDYYDVPTTEHIEVGSDKVYFGIQANDYMENSLRLGVFRMKLIVDNQVLFGWQMNNIGYDETRYMNALGDYKTKMGQGFWLQLCHRLPNDKLGIYINGTQKNGIVDIGDGKVHQVIIRVYDVKGNSKDVRFSVQQATTQPSSSACSSNLMKAGIDNEYKDNYVHLKLPKQTLYDQVCMRTQITMSDNANSHIYHIAHAGIPVHDAYKLALKPKIKILENQKNQVAIRYSPNDDMSDPVGQAARVDDDWVVADVLQFGNFEIVIDQTPPAIIPYFKSGSTVSKGTVLSFGVEDAVTDVKEVQFKVDGKWLRCVRRRNNYYYTVDEHFPKGEHEVEILALDANNNSNIKKFKLTR